MILGYQGTKPMAFNNVDPNVLAPHQRSTLFFRRIFVASRLVLSGQFVRGQEPDVEPDTLPPIATSGDIEIDEIQITRRQSSDQARSADLTNMSLGLWFASKEELPERALLQILELDPIHDNTGKLLTTDGRLNALQFLKKDFLCDERCSKRGKHGPVIHLRLDAPAREATSIKAIKGKAVLSRAELLTIDFKDLAEINGKTLEHPKLKEFPIEPKIELVDNHTEVSLCVPKNYRRLYHWGLFNKSRRELPSVSQGFDPQDTVVILDKTYRGDHTKGSILRIVLAETRESREMDFQFADIPLP